MRHILKSSHPELLQPAIAPLTLVINQEIGKLVNIKKSTKRIAKQLVNYSYIDSPYNLEQLAILDLKQVVNKHPNTLLTVIKYAPLKDLSSLLSTCIPDSIPYQQTTLANATIYYINTHSFNQWQVIKTLANSSHVNIQQGAIYVVC